MSGPIDSDNNIRMLGIGDAIDQYGNISRYYDDDGYLIPTNISEELTARKSRRKRKQTHPKKHKTRSKGRKTRSKGRKTRSKSKKR